jgi:hypothetical protein
MPRLQCSRGLGTFQLVVHDTTKINVRIRNVEAFDPFLHILASSFPSMPTSLVAGVAAIRNAFVRGSIVVSWGGAGTSFQEEDACCSAACDVARCYLYVY